jgi:hypothetical protein
VTTLLAIALEHDLLVAAAERAVQERRYDLAATYRRMRSAVAAESMIRDHDGELVDHDSYVRPIVDRVLAVRRRDAQLRAR